MASFRNVSDDARRVSYGLPAPRWVEPDATFDVGDEFSASYACQPRIWEQIAGPVPDLVASGHAPALTFVDTAGNSEASAEQIASAFAPVAETLSSPTTDPTPDTAGEPDDDTPQEG